MSWRLLAEVRDRDFAPIGAQCRARRDKAGEAAPIPFNAAHGKLLMLLLAEWCNDEGAAVYPRSKAAFASACQLSERQVQRLFAGLIEVGLVKIEREADARAKAPRIYRINIGALLDLPLTGVAEADRERQRRARARTGDQQSPQGETSSRKTGDQESGTGDQQSPIVTPTTPKQPQEAPPLGSPPHDRNGSLFTEPGQETSHYHASKQPNRGTRLERDWRPPPDDWDLGRALGLNDAEIADQLDRFRDHWTAKPGKDGLKLDWAATFRNWLRKADDFGRGPGAARRGYAGSERGGPASVVAAVNRIRD